MSLSERSQSSEANESEESVKACLEDMRSWLGSRV